MKMHRLVRGCKPASPFSKCVVHYGKAMRPLDEVPCQDFGKTKCVSKSNG